MNKNGKLINSKKSRFKAKDFGYNLHHEENPYLNTKELKNAHIKFHAKTQSKIPK